ncbi:MAG: hypothetical protein ACOY35_11215 [Bacillota bacterium]|nr:hypothetical protein [Bacillota bacterium]
MVTTFILLSVIYAAIIFGEVPRMVSQQRWRELLVFSILLLPAITYSYAMTLDIILPNPTVFISKIFAPVYEQLARFLSTSHFGSF